MSEIPHITSSVTQLQALTGESQASQGLGLATGDAAYQIARSREAQESRSTQCVPMPAQERIELSPWRCFAAVTLKILSLAGLSLLRLP
jgi:hypothetical protein